ncbi:MAG: hypothetical protein HQ542_10075 [Bacteroidia bacterium]|nr:hypothetical protein [Bacteroidia bacterium]
METNNHHDVYLIGRFLEGRLDKPALTEFHKRMQEDPEFAAQVELQRKLPEYWRQAERYQQVSSEVRRSLQATAQRGVFRLNRLVYAIAASIIVVVGLALVFILTNQSGVGTDQMAEDSDTLFIPTVEQVDHKATIEEVMPGKEPASLPLVELIRPVQNATFMADESIVFEWIHGDTISMDLKIFEVASGKFVYTRTVEAFLSTDTLQVNSLQPGRYFWYLGDKSKKRSFTILKQ